MQHVDRDSKGVEIKTDVDVITDADCITMDDGDLRSGVKKMIDDRIGEVIDGAPEELDTLKEIATELEKNQSGVSTIIKAMNNKLEAKDLEGYAKSENLEELRHNISVNIQDDLDKMIYKSQVTDSYTTNSIDTIPCSKALSDGLIDQLSYVNKSFSDISEALDKKVDVVEAKGLSTNDFTDVDKRKLDAIEDGAQKNTVTSVNGMTGNVTIEAGNVDLSGYAKNTDIVDFKRCIVISETNYAALSDAEKNRADTLYFLI